MAKFPINTEDDSVSDALNYLLSGPGGLGQNFNGFTSYSVAYLTGNYRTPFTQPTTRNLYVPPIDIATCETVNGRTTKVTFASTQPSPPFNPGDQVYINGSSNDWYDGYYSVIGILSCTTTECYIRYGVDYGLQDIGYGGTIELNLNDTDLSTDCNARVNVTGGTDRVFISGQLDQTLTYNSTSLATLDFTVKVNRYIGFINDDPVNPDYLFDLDGTVAEKDYSFELDGTGTQTISTVFSTLLDEPNPGYYWYILEIYYVGDPIIENIEFGLRSLSAQVVKQ